MNNTFLPQTVYFTTHPNEKPRQGMLVHNNMVVADDDHEVYLADHWVLKYGHKDIKEN